MSEPKPFRGWAVFKAGGAMCWWTITPNRSRSIKAFTANYGVEWRRYRVRGYTCRRVVVTAESET